MSGIAEDGNIESQLTAENEEVVWQQFVIDRSDAVRHTLIEAYVPFARILAAKAYSNRIGNEFEFEEYMQLAVLGLIEAVDRYDPAKGATFKTYSSYRITGAILSGLESLSEKQEQLTLLKRLRRERLESLKDPAEADNSDDLFAKLADVALGLALGFMLEDCGLYRDADSETPDSAYGALEAKELRHYVRSRVSGLPERERNLIILHYYQHIPFEQIAKKLGISKGRVSQLHRKALSAMQVLFERQQGFDRSL